MMKTAIVAGGAGFIGSHLCQALLEDGNRVICVDNLVSGLRENISHLEESSRFEFLEHDVCAPITFDKDIDEVYNLASMASSRDDFGAHRVMTSVVATHRLLTLAERHGARFLQASTGEIYARADVKGLREETWRDLRGERMAGWFDEGRRAPESVCREFLLKGGIPIRVARIFDTYGPQMRHDDRHILSGFISRALAARPIPLFENGMRTRTLCHVGDIVNGLLALMRSASDPGGPVNFGSSEERTELQIAEQVSRAAGVAINLSHQPLPRGERLSRVPDISRARAMLSWNPQVPFGDGLRGTVAWFRSSLAEDQADDPVSRVSQKRYQVGL
jgi:UDP-glucuronate decarboxylase